MTKHKTHKKQSPLKGILKNVLCIKKILTITSKFFLNHSVGLISLYDHICNSMKHGKSSGSQSILNLIQNAMHYHQPCEACLETDWQKLGSKSSHLRKEQYEAVLTRFIRMQRQCRCATTRLKRNH